tara:strand:- start:272 stop:439 length:168 start_codon:yes stop_codon:yes gene_type:complete
MNKLLLTDDELDFLTDVLDQYDYTEENEHLYLQLDYKLYKTTPQSYQDKLTTIGG